MNTYLKIRSHTLVPIFLIWIIFIYTNSLASIRKLDSAHYVSYILEDTVKGKNVKKINSSKNQLVQKLGFENKGVIHENQSSHIEVKGKIQTQIFDKKINPLSNINITTLSPKVSEQLSVNKSNNVDMFNGIRLIYLIEIIEYDNHTNDENIINVWKNIEAYRGSKKMGNGKLYIFLDPYFDTELSEEIMNLNNFKVKFMDEYYATENFELEH